MECQMNTHFVTGGGGVKLHVREWGKPDSPAILFIHGWSQNHLCWRRQVESGLAGEFRLVALDLRGHGMSEMPMEAENYTNPRAWADDIAAIIAQLNLVRPVLVGWSYAGFIICDYIRAFGEDSVAGINFVGGAVTLNAAAFGTLIGPGFLDHVPGATADDLPANIQAVRAFIQGCTAQPLSREDYESVLCSNMVVPAKIRAALLAREIDSDDALRSFGKPVLVTHGRSDTVVIPPKGEHSLKTCRTSAASWYDKTGHAPLLEDAPRFNRELADFARKVA
jgi:pimeloyl-ACP methyl ester carboxylesterase